MENPPEPLTSPEESRAIFAYELTPSAKDWTLTAAPYQRQLMDDTPGRGAYRCLPLSMANQAGWFLHAPVSFNAVWNGEVDPTAVQIDFEESSVDGTSVVMSHFGSGIVTFRLPFLFRTPPGIGLLVRGAPNWPLVNFAPLEGLVETDWNPSSFTMNWKILEPNRPVRFNKEVPVCFIQPFDLDLPERLEAARKPLDRESDIGQEYMAWREGRANFLGSEAQKRGEWQKDYFRGVDAASKNVASHRTNFRLSEFSAPGE
ncbi:MAG TPA: DUF6065 family protein [Verrucomicrobium sp.]|nr:DUF6065 family protein [Verrucomicrobium sp.]